MSRRAQRGHGAAQQEQVPQRAGADEQDVQGERPTGTSTRAVATLPSEIGRPEDDDARTALGRGQRDLVALLARVGDAVHRVDLLPAAGVDRHLQLAHGARVVPHGDADAVRSAGIERGRDRGREVVHLERGAVLRAGEGEGGRVARGVRGDDPQQVAPVRHGRGVPGEDRLVEARRAAGCHRSSPTARYSHVEDERVAVRVLRLPREGAQAALVELAAEADRGRAAGGGALGGRAIAQRVGVEAEDLGLAAHGDRLLEGLAGRVDGDRLDDRRQVALLVRRGHRLDGGARARLAGQGQAQLEEARLLAADGLALRAGRRRRPVGPRRRPGSPCCPPGSGGAPPFPAAPCPPRRPAPSSRPSRCPSPSRRRSPPRRARRRGRRRGPGSRSRGRTLPEEPRAKAVTCSAGSVATSAQRPSSPTR